MHSALRVNRRLEEVDRENLPSVRAEEVEIALFEGNSLLAAYLVDNRNPAWEKRFRESQPRFQQWIARVSNLPPFSDAETDLLQDLKATWSELDARREEVISLAKEGEIDRARSLLLTEVDGRLCDEVNRLYRKVIGVHEDYSETIMDHAKRRMRSTTWVVGISGVLTLLLGGFLLWLFFYRVLLPLRGMVADAELYRGDRQGDSKRGVEDELRMMGDHLRSLMSDVSDTRSRLDRSRDRLLAAEKLASVGKLAASVAHEIRNPLTAMKMWLYSIQDAIRGNADVVRKLGIVSEEIARLESIVRDFLEFSRPAVVHCQPQEIGAVIAQTLELLGPRLLEKKFGILATSLAVIPPVLADAGQLKQVFLNLIGNAMDAMDGGGEIRIASAVEKNLDGQPMVVIRICDTGPGMPPQTQARIFEPFFSTKEAGTGLGLCIAVQIMARHGGSLVLESSTEKGTTFAAWLPIAPESVDAQDSSS
jgi:signal transduction histidine kinase